MYLHLAVLVALILLSAFFSGAETAFTALSILQVERLQAEKGVRGKMIAKLARRPDILLGTVLIGNNLANISASALATEITIRTIGNQAVGYVTGILTLVILIFAEITPKRVAIIYNETICLHTVRLVTFLSYLFRPLIWVIGAVSSLITRFRTSRRRINLTLEGLLHMVNLAESMGVVATQETRMVRSVFRFNDLPVQAIMTHRTQVFSLEMGKTIAEALPEISERGFSRIPVYDEHPEKIEGIVHVKDILGELSAGRSSTRLKEIMIHPLFLSTSRKINEVFAHFKREHCSMAIIMDEYGGLAGIVTEEDITEEVLGELHEENEEIGWEKITPIENGAYRILGTTPLYQVNDFFGTSLKQNRYAQTLGGYLAEYLGRFPAEHEEIVVPKARFIIEKVANNRIVSIRCVPLAGEEEHEEAKVDS